MRYIFLLPFWVAQIFTQTKSFTKNPVLGNRWLNIMGLHIARMVLSHAIMRLRMLMLSKGIKPVHRYDYYNNGYIIIQDALDEESFRLLKEEVHNAKAQVRECKQGDTLTHRILLDSNTLSNLPKCQEILNHPYYKKLLRFASGKKTKPIPYIQTIKNQYISGSPDPQKTLHSDTFHPTMKSWYFLDNVDERNGPLTYIPGSNRLTFARLKWEYKKSIAVSDQLDRYSNNGSIRVSASDTSEMKLKEAQPFKVRANTLVIANTHGFHLRGKATQCSTRTEIWTISRNNPFNPLPGIDHPWLNNLQIAILNQRRDYCDKKAKSLGTISSWHKIKARNTIASK